MWWGLIIQDFVSKAKDLKLNSGGNKKKPIYYIYTGMSLFETIKLLFDVWVLLSGLFLRVALHYKGNSVGCPFSLYLLSQNVFLINFLFLIYIVAFICA